MKRIEERLRRAWDILVSRAVKHKDSLQAAKVGYEDFVRAVEGKTDDENVSGRTSGNYLHPIQRICADSDLPPLTGLVVQERKDHKTGEYKKLKPSSGFAGSGLQTYAEEMSSVLRHDWKAEGNPFLGADGKAVDEGKVLKGIATGASIFTYVKNRGYAQTLFRDGLLKAYSSKCAVCGIAFEEILDAAHIKPWSVCEGEEGGTLSNGILLCKNHHRSFDRGLWWLSDDFTIEAKIEFKASSIGKRTITIWTPDDKAISPDPLFLQYHRANKPD
ncbi:hypothetical protein FUA23_21850 [Neolewinella aurantiaca]|uniref:HNH nuclease domain-containing protein n=1 Tax=Neolewinella aurantiaca TaxID=2602767 RepID=A0A5C7F3N4_9BACT|nr:HNH endonuclease [Neolewinella aurantiaca]TXF82283.1 hypothetical protein FUA23_21850 [Neolewinella aurantiaca]